MRHKRYFDMRIVEKHRM